MNLTYTQKKVHYVQNDTLIGVLPEEKVASDLRQTWAEDRDRDTGHDIHYNIELQGENQPEEARKGSLEGFETGGRDLDNEKLLENFQRKIKRQMWVGWFGTKGEWA